MLSTIQMTLPRYTNWPTPSIFCPLVQIKIVLWQTKLRTMGFSKSICLLFHIKGHLLKIHNSVEGKQISSAYSRLLSNYYIVHWNFPRPPAKKARRTSPIARSKVIMTRCNPGWVHFWLQTSSRFHLLLNYNILGRHVIVQWSVQEKQPYFYRPRWSSRQWKPRK